MLLKVTDSWTLAQSKVCISLVLFGMCPANTPGFFKCMWGGAIFPVSGEMNTFRLLQRFQFKQSDCPFALKLCRCSSICPLSWHHQKWEFFAPAVFAQPVQQRGLSCVLSDLCIKAGGHCGQPAALVTTTPSQSILPSPLLTVKADSLHVTPPPSPPHHRFLVLHNRLYGLRGQIGHTAGQESQQTFPLFPILSQPLPPSTPVHPPTRDAGSFPLPCFPQGATQETCKEIFCKIKRLKVVPSDLL